MGPACRPTGSRFFRPSGVIVEKAVGGLKRSNTSAKCKLWQVACLFSRNEYILSQYEFAFSALGDLLFGRLVGGPSRFSTAIQARRSILRQISREIDASVWRRPAGVKTLSDIGLSPDPFRQQVYFQCKPRSSCLEELNALIAKPWAFFQPVSAALVPFAKKISVAFVYGSMARHDERPAADVDLMVVGMNARRCFAAMAPVERAIGRSINPTLYP